jgi:glycosyltransferase involved in cell wall biosynthesis
MTKLFIYAINVHRGGGAVLLLDLLRAIPSEVEAIVYLDTRMSLPIKMSNHCKFVRVKPTLLSRLAAECRLAMMVQSGDRVLCFGNLPPLIRLRGDTVVFLQNRYLLDSAAPLSALPLKTTLRIRIERSWLIFRRFNASRYIVQTASMKRLAIAKLHRPVSCVPFVPFSSPSPISADTLKKQFDFLYVASGEAHKNHQTLILAWRVLADEGLFPSLALTLSPQDAPVLCALVDQEVSSRGLRIYNLGALPYERISVAYGNSKALIYPSVFESFGLPLLEAKAAGLQVLAPELDYVRDVIDPNETFDPRSPVSIARSVKRHFQGKRQLTEPSSAEAFIDQILASDIS